ncbi:Phosphoglycolate phosphatase, HAD superfamily [Flavobacterium aquidurense]|uniref:phosphoglycolate phosphatase n=1 Tax=Flavobacterium frigidimaris TaxID=262320 RepID=A0ABX4BNB5_FLAFR|nr:HAD hydrolase-like protein [Flavobacterium frigidimaris]OXA77565.1 haloacid dehalogenase [Flavobacterium frigidimaris]SDY89699.1 Phosphoglycolate phosphatase, HAD superfamily [Flavobacterium aquidurense]
MDKFKIILWDFDGVIMDSMPVRDKGFEIVLQNYPQDQVSLLMEYHRNNGGLSRYNKFRYFFEEIRKESVTDSEIKVLAEEFSVVMLENLLNSKLLINDSLNFIKENYLKYKMHIVSGSDGNELRYICEKLGLSKYFSSIHGSPTPKNKLVEDLMTENNYNNDETCLIGDSFNDLEAAEVNKIVFFGYNNEKLKGLRKNFIHSFKNYSI